MYTYRQLGGGDVAKMKELNRVFGEAFNDAESYQSALPSDEYLQKFLAKEEAIVLVAEAADVIVGGLVAYELKKFEQERSEIYIYDLAVAAEHRRKGIATALIEKLKAIAKERGAYIIYVQADKADAPAIELYKKLGRGEDVLHFDIPVE